MQNDGHLINSRLTEYMMPTTYEFPGNKHLIVEILEPTSPIDVTGILEIATLPIVPVIANTVPDANGVIVFISCYPRNILDALDWNSFDNIKKEYTL